jgi:hypothetical protein
MTRLATIFRVALVVALQGAALQAPASGTTEGATHKAAPDSCDRTCLKGLVDSYLAALVAHDPSQVPLASNLRFVENTVPLRAGDGFWKTATALPSTFKIYVADPVAQQVGFIGVMQEGDQTVELGLRLKLHKGRITEAEHLVARQLRPTSLPNLQSPRPGLLSVVPPAERSSREELLKTGASYYDALVNSDGHSAPFADDCLRRENGMQTTGNLPPATPGRGTMGAMGCAAQLDTRVMSYIKRIEPRRVEIADVETGLVFGLSQFRHPMEEKSLEIVGVPGVESVDMPFKPFDLPAAHIFKVSGGRIHEIEALGFTMPYNSKTGWE